MFKVLIKVSSCFIIGSFFLIVIFLQPVLGYVRSSSNYRLQSDSINIGGNFSSSTIYHMGDTIGEIATGNSSSTSFSIKAGYQQMQEVYLAMSNPVDVALTPSIPGVTGGTANGSVIWTVITDGPAGYTMSLKASTDSALACSSGCNIATDRFSDYTPVTGGVPDYTWSISNSTAEFGFSPEGTDVAAKFKDDGVSACNTGSNETADKCWYNLATTDTIIASTAAGNHPAGTATAVKFKAQSGSANVQPAGSYQAVVTATVVAN